MLFNKPLPAFDQYTSHSYTEILLNTTTFYTRNGDSDSNDAALPVD
jgi:hypothetical protein